MSNFYYIELSGDLVIGISSLSGEIFQDNMVEIDESIYDSSLIGKLYQNGEFIEQEG